MSSVSGGAAAAPGSCGGLYAPLRQLVSDSESDEEVRNRSQRNLQAPETVAPLDINSGLHVNKNYSLSDLDELSTNPNTNTIDTTMDNISFLHSDSSNKMSLPRKISFIMSIFLCIFTVVTFLWFIPCSENGACSAKEWRDKTTSWELPYEDIELSGSVQVVDGAQPNAKNLIFIYRGNHMKKRESKDLLYNGVLLIVGNSGKIGWYTHDLHIPTQINCHLLDVNMDGRKDCIVTGSEGLLTAINPLLGTYYWHFKRNQKNQNVVSIDFPAVMRDVDGDRIDDLLTSVTIMPNTNHNYLLLISGASGKVIGEPLLVEECNSIHDIEVNSSSNVTYSCQRNSTQFLRVLSYNQLEKYILRPDPKLSHFFTPIKNEHLNLSLKKNIGSKISNFKNGKGKLRIENSGECPDSCRVNVKLSIEKNGTAWQYSANHVYAVQPSSFSFADSIHGFVLKL